MTWMQWMPEVLGLVVAVVLLALVMNRVDPRGIWLTFSPSYWWLHLRLLWVMLSAPEVDIMIVLSREHWVRLGDRPEQLRAHLKQARTACRHREMLFELDEGDQPEWRWGIEDMSAQEFNSLMRDRMQMLSRVSARDTTPARFPLSLDPPQSSATTQIGTISLG